MRSPAQLTAETERGHRRGVVLGLTMAELLLLLLFCLLLVSAGVLGRQKEELTRASQDAQSARDELAQIRQTVPADGVDPKVELVALRRRVEMLTSLAPSEVAADAPIPSETWRELVLAKDLAEQLAASGLSERIADPQFVEATASLTKFADAQGLTLSELMLLVEKASTGIHDWPPIITLGNDDFRFPLNSAQISADFRNRIRTSVLNQVLDLLARYPVDVIEVVGHTDEQPIRSTQSSTLDDLAISVLAGEEPITKLIPADNAGLGLARAIAVANELTAAGLPKGVRVIPLSAAQILLPGDQVSLGLDAEDNPNRRRIEIRVRRSTESPT